MTLACVDIGSTFTKAALADPATGQLLATAQAQTTLDDVVTGVLLATAGFPDAPWWPVPAPVADSGWRWSATRS
jgi:hypothetical protein